MGVWILTTVWALFVLAFAVGYLRYRDCPKGDAEAVEKYYAGLEEEYDSLGRAVPVVSTLLIIATIVGSLPELSDHGAKAVILGFWLTIPPMWFSFEYFVFYRRLFLKGTEPEADRRVGGLSWEQFKYGQESAAKVWGAVVVFLGALFFKSP